MRDLSRYPICREEVVDFLRDLSKKIGDKESIGDLRPLMCLVAAAAISAEGSVPTRAQHEAAFAYGDSLGEDNATGSNKEA